MDALDKLGISWQLLLSQIVNFGLLMVILQQLLYKPVLNMLDQRRQRIAEGLEQADKASNAAAEAEAEKQGILEEARREAQEVRAQATRDAERIAQDIRSRADQEAQEIRMKGQADAEAQTAAVMADARKQIADLTIAATEQILGRELANRDEQERFVNDYLAQQNGSGS